MTCHNEDIAIFLLGIFKKIYILFVKIHRLM